MGQLRSTVARSAELTWVPKFLGSDLARHGLFSVPLTFDEESCEPFSNLDHLNSSQIVLTRGSQHLFN